MSGATSGKKEIVIVGAGIAGVCTAYYLSRHPQYDRDKHHITIVEACEPAGGASGKAGGLLALWAFPKAIVPLSFQLHDELAKEHGGDVKWGYRRVGSVQVNAHETRPGGRTSKARFPPGLDWLKSEAIDSVEQFGHTHDTAQVHPYQFTTTLLALAQEAGADLVRAKVTEILVENGVVKGVRYQVEGKQQDALLADKVACTAGPWTSTLLHNCPISGTRAHSITVQVAEPVSAYALFTNVQLNSGEAVSPEIYARKDEIYICGEGDTSEPLPETSAQVVVDRQRCNDIFDHASVVSSQVAEGTVTRRQACYLPTVNVTTGPFLGETNVKGLYIGAGHSCWGINNGPATGKLLAELILDGKAHSAKIRSLDPTRYFQVN